ncbi:MAG: primosomal protein N', partial [Bacilli bacterium]|nr:primosomal protein N' [Bacilli bacterium]
MIIDVLVELSNKNIDKTFSYLVPSQYIDLIKVGIRVLVPFGSQKLEGFVIKINDSSSSLELKEIIDVIDREVILSEELLELGKYISNSTLSTLISSYQVMLPKALKAKNGVTINKKIDKYITLNILDDYGTLNEPQKKIIDILLKDKRVLKSNLDLISSSSIKTLLKKKIINIELQEDFRLNDECVLKEKYPLTSEQLRVIDEIDASKEEVYLLHGVTGSGKTEVYMELIEKELLKGKESIVLVPEISLTEQIVGRFRSRFGKNIAILHSRLSDGERYDEYRKIKNRDVKIVVGARSAIFAPFDNIGIIIIDEEHTSSYKQDNNPKYSSIDIALYRGRCHKAKVVLGSATPMLETYARALKGNYKLIELKKRVNDKELPKVIIVDMLKEDKKNNFYFSKTLIEEMNISFSKNEQVILLL